MIIDGISTSQHLDSSGEILDVKNHDISDLEEGRGVLNWEHNNDSSEDIIGKIIFATKIMKRDDCSNDRERLYWDFCKAPFVYIKAELFDGEMHPGAIAAAAIVRYYHKRKEKILAGFSIEGATLERDDNMLKRTVGRRVAMTLKPCNKTAISGVLEDSSFSDAVKKYVNMDSVIDLDSYQVDSCILEDIIKSENPVQELKDSLMVLQKTLTAGGANVSPSQLTGGSALTPEYIISHSQKNKIKAAIRDWDRTRPLKEAIKAALPDVSEQYLDYFTGLAEEISLKKGMSPLQRIGAEHSTNKNADEDQRNLVNGIYIDKGRPFKGLDDEPRATMNKFKNDVGDEVLLKIPREGTEGLKNFANNATNYYHMAKNFFGMGEHVPITNHVTHDAFKDAPTNTAQVIKFHSKAKTAFSPEFDKAFQTGRENGSVHKLALMDMITGGDFDRHFGNVLADKGRIMHIDNDDAFDYDYAPSITPHYYSMNTDDSNEDIGIGQDTIHADANKWLQDLNPKVMLQHMRKLGISAKQMREAAKRLKVLQTNAPTGMKFNDLFQLVHRMPQDRNEEIE
jgi:hypothetical protein